MSEQASTTDQYKQKRFRSPPYPAIPLAKAVERAKELYEKAQHHSVPTHVLANAWGYTTKSSAINSTSAALKQFGLLNDEGSGGKRRFNLTDQAIRIIKDPIPDSPKRKEAVKRAALAPKIHSELWEQFGLSGLSGSMDPTLLSFLTIDKKESGVAPYSESAAQEVISVYKETINFAGLGHSDIVPGLEANEPGTENQFEDKKSSDKKFGGAKVGDMVQWESSGDLKFDNPKRVRAIRKQDDVEWVFVDGSEAGIRMSEVIVEEKGGQADGGGITPPRLAMEPETPPPGLWKEVTDLDEGGVVLTLPDELSPESYEDLKTWMDFILRKAKRRAGVQ